MAVEKLVRETYFISPKYDYSHGKEDRIDDKSDDLGKWVKQNTHPHVFKGLVSRRPFTGGRLMGRNGVFCEIMHQPYYLPGKLEIAFGTSGSYHILVKILSSPSSKDLPVELVDSLAERNYEEKPKDCMLDVTYPPHYPRKVPLKNFFWD